MDGKCKGHDGLKAWTNVDNQVFTRRDFLKLAGALGLAPLVNALPYPHFQPSLGSPATPNVIIVLFDAMSANNLSLYGYPRRTTPNLERLAKRATVYHNHHSASNFTSPSTASFFTGVYPTTHRAFSLGGLINQSILPYGMFQLLGQAYYQAVFTQNYFVDVLLYQFEKHLQRHVRMDSFNLAGYTIANHLFPKDGIPGQKSYDQFLFRREEPHGALFLSILNDLVLGFKGRSTERELKRLYPLGPPRIASTDVYFSIREVMDGLQNLLNELPAPFLAYFHLMFPHAPYRPDREYFNHFMDGWKPQPKKKHDLATGTDANKTNRQRQSYDEFVANLDDEFGRLFDHLDSSGLLENSYLIVTSDHGELFERGEVGHSTRLLFEPVIHVPLLIAAPGQRERQDVYDLTSTVDLLPSLLQIAGLPIPDRCEGRPLPGLGGQADSQRSVYVVDAKNNPAYSPIAHASIALIRWPYKLVRYMGYRGHTDSYEFYDLKNDPEEMANQYIGNSIAQEMQAILEQKLAEVDAPYLGRRSNGLTRQ